MRALFQILIGVATQSTVVSTTRKTHQADMGSMCRKKSRVTLGWLKRHPRVWRNSSSATGASSRMTAQSTLTFLTMRQM